MIDEDKRLRRLGIDPDGDPLETLRKLRQIQQELGETTDEPDGDDGPDEPAVVDSPEEPR